MVECWNNGLFEFDSNDCFDFQAIVPSFQYSNIPLLYINLLKFITLNSGLVFFQLLDKCLHIGFGLFI